MKMVVREEQISMIIRAERVALNAMGVRVLPEMMVIGSNQVTEAESLEDSCELAERELILEFLGRGFSVV